MVDMHRRDLYIRNNTRNPSLKVIQSKTIGMEVQAYQVREDTGTGVIRMVQTQGSILSMQEMIVVQQRDTR